jgi:hypothetical protein
LLPDTGLLGGDHRGGGLADRQPTREPVGLGVVIDQDGTAVVVALQVTGPLLPHTIEECPQRGDFGMESLQSGLGGSDDGSGTASEKRAFRRDHAGIGENLQVSS